MSSGRVTRLAPTVWPEIPTREPSIIRLTVSGARLATTAVAGNSSRGKTTFLTIEECRISELALFIRPS